ncbi:Uncharacterized 43.4 kDa protein [Anthophora retusa]
MNDIAYNVYLVTLVVGLAFAIYTFLYYRLDRAEIVRENEKLGQKLQSGPLESLLNGSGINNIPQLNIISTNLSITKASNCSKGPVFIGETGTRDDCIKLCANSSANAIHVQAGERYLYGSSMLQEGTHCTIGPKPECNMHTSVALMTINSVVCRSKFPRIIGGTLGTSMIACNNQYVLDPQNYLWDYKENRKFDPLRDAKTLLDEDELLENGQYRYRCKFNGYDKRENRYIEHPYDRFHPISNYCASGIYRAHPDVRTIFDLATETFRCDCGNEAETRVKNLDPLDPSSICSNNQRRIVKVEKEKYRIDIPYKCFTMFSLLEDVSSSFPCSNEQFTREGNQTGITSIEYTKSDNEPIEHPLYGKMTGPITIYMGLEVG